MITTAARFPQPTKTGALHIGAACDERLPRTVDGHPHAVHAVQAWDDPASGWRCGGGVDGVRPGCLVMGPVVAPSAWCHRLDQAGARQPQQAPRDPTGLCDPPRRDTPPRRGAHPAAPVHRGRACVGREALGSLPRAGADMGAEHTPGLAVLLVRHGRVSRPDGGRDGPGEGLDRPTGRRTAVARGAWLVREGVGVARGIRPALGPCRQRRVGRFRRREASGVSGQEGLVDRGLVAWPGVGARGRGALLGRLGRHPQPTLGQPVVAQLTTLSAGVVLKARPTVPREGWRAGLGDRAPGVGQAGDQAEVAEVGGVRFVVPWRVGDRSAWGGHAARRPATPVPAPGTARCRRSGRPHADAHRGSRRLERPAVPTPPAAGPVGAPWHTPGCAAWPAHRVPGWTPPGVPRWWSHEGGRAARCRRGRPRTGPVHATAGRRHRPRPPRAGGRACSDGPAQPARRPATPARGVCWHKTVGATTTADGPSRAPAASSQPRLRPA